MTTETVRCDELNRWVPVSEALIVTLGQGKNYVACKYVIDEYLKVERRTFPCKDGERGLDVYTLSFHQGAIKRGEFLFSIGDHPQILLPRIEAGLLVDDTA